MTKHLVLWRFNPMAPWPTDPSKLLELNEKLWAGIDELTKKGGIKEFGYFPDGNSGYGFGEGESADIFRDTSMFFPYVHCEVHEVIPYERGRQTIRTLLKARIAAVKK